MGQDQAPDFTFDDPIEQAFQAFLAVVHARAEIGNHIDSPSLTGAIQFKHLLLSLKVRSLIVTRNTCVGDGLARGLRITLRMRP